MGHLFAAIRKLVSGDKYVVGKHAAERLEERGIMEWQVVAGMDDGELIVERPAASPNPVVDVRETLPDGPQPHADIRRDHVQVRRGILAQLRRELKVCSS